MLTKRIIPCLDVKDGRTVKGINFVDLRDAGDPIELSAHYAQNGADELVLLDISATNENRKTLKHLVEEVARNVNIPFTVGGGISSVTDVYSLLHAGADKISVNSAAVKRPGLLTELAREFGSQCVVLAVDATCYQGSWTVHIESGQTSTPRYLMEWIEEATDRGAGEILFTSMDHDGTKNGFANDVLSEISDIVPVPLIASGGAGNMQHFADVFKHGKADAALAASVFHYNEIQISELKKMLDEQGVNVRL